MRMIHKMLVAPALMALSLAAGAQPAWPDHPIALVVPFSAGGPTDVVARMIAIPMSKALGQPVTVENAVGAGGTIAATKVARVSERIGRTFWGATASGTSISRRRFDGGLSHGM